MYGNRCPITAMLVPLSLMGILATTNEPPLQSRHLHTFHKPTWGEDNKKGGQASLSLLALLIVTLSRFPSSNAAKLV